MGSGDNLGAALGAALGTVLGTALGTVGSTKEPLKNHVVAVTWEGHGDTLGMSVAGAPWGDAGGDTQTHPGVAAGWGCPQHPLGAPRPI